MKILTMATLIKVCTVNLNVLVLIDFGVLMLLVAYFQHLQIHKSPEIIQEIIFSGSGNYGNSYNRGRNGSRGGPRGGSGRGGRGGGGHSGMSNGYNQRGGGRPNFSNSRGGGYNGNNRGGSRGIVPYSSH